MSAYYKNSEVAKKFGVSNPTVGYWIKASIQGNNNLEITEIEGKKYILVNENNNAELVRLSNEGKKHIPENSNKIKIVYATETFYSKFSLSEQLEIYADLKYTKKINLKFWYKADEIVEFWDKEVVRKRVSPIVNFHLYSLKGVMHAIEDLYQDKRVINIFDLGPGNGEPIRAVLDFLLPTNNVNKYIGIDISENMAEKVKFNLKSWGFNMETHMIIEDFEKLDLQGTLMLHSLNTNKYRNFVFFLGNTICNFQEPAKMLNKVANAMFDEDVLFLGLALKSFSNTMDLAYIKQPREVEKKLSWIYTALGFDFDDFEISYRYDKNLSSKIQTFRLKVSYQINLTINSENLSIDLHKGTEIIRWQHYLFEIEDLIPILQANKLELKLLKTDPTQSNAILVCTKAKEY